MSSIPMQVSTQRLSARVAASSNRAATTRRSLVEVIVALIILSGSGLLMWGSVFASNMVHDQLSDQRIAFPPKGPALSARQYPGLQQYAGEAVDNGPKAKAYANEFIGAHLKGVAASQTYAEVSRSAMAARSAADAAVSADSPDAAALTAKAAKLEAQTQTLFRGETLRGLLLYAWGWWVVGRIAFVVSVSAAVLAIVLLVLAFLGYQRASTSDASFAHSES
jgi:hypothetical protein